MAPTPARSSADWLAEGDAHYDAQRWNEAGDALAQGVSLDPRHARGWYRLGNVREEQGRDDDAIACFDRAVALDPGHAQAWNNLGGARQRRGFYEQAVAAYHASMGADPALAQPCLNLGQLAVVRGDLRLAAECFEAGLRHHPDDPTFQHLLASVAGRRMARASEGYITTLFDGFASHFERHLVQGLQYRVPEALVQMVLPGLAASRATSVPASVIDLGCGTGLVGVALKGSCDKIIGVDLSPRMLEIAATRGVYTELVRGQLVEVLARCAPDSTQAVLAADVFIYLGDLEPVFAAVARVLAPGGMFALSVEGLPSGDYRLQPSGRFAQSPAYLRALARGSGLSERRMEPARIRCEGSGYAEGWLALFAKPATAAASSSVTGGRG